MKIKELIKSLSEYNQDSVVWIDVPGRKRMLNVHAVNKIIVADTKQDMADRVDVSITVAR